MDDGIERRALLLHLGDVLEASACVMKCANRFNTVGEAVGQEESLMSFTILRMVDAEITPYEFAKRAASTFFLWPKLLLDESINRALLANLVQHDLFPGNQSGWESYVSELRHQVPWFADGLDQVPEGQFEKSVAVWPPTAH
ncbi:hypothetical protein AWB64_04819 [Caballeronia sordidicola]|uniref:Uncharacterized protein n=1 Tax=Caballeronia sordidicola TaxID=196367 RepID=A0A158HPL6_CABSO|nr:hypothetical protein [Caballeronia sordidicola]SAL45630.1 hypothetical protein AWB64_04819 [Caballeronia sordidicola]